MTEISTPAILLRRINYGDYDLICTFFTLENGKVPLIAKSAKKSKKRFAGVLEPYSVVNIVYTGGRHRKLPMLKEASVVDSFSTIRTDITKTAYAAFMAELIHEHMEERSSQPQAFHLYRYALEALDQEVMPAEAASILFQMRFMALSGFCPGLTHCLSCGCKTEDMTRRRVSFDLKKGGVVCEACAVPDTETIGLSMGTLKQLLWLERSSIAAAARIRFSDSALRESLALLEAFVPFYLGKDLKSLKFIQQLRGAAQNGPITAVKGAEHHRLNNEEKNRL